MSDVKLERVWARRYTNGVHFSTTKKDGFTAFVPESLALAMFLRAQLSLLGVDMSIEHIEAELKKRSEKTSRAPARAEQNTKKGKRK
jgi:hypothetical protein